MAVLAEERKYKRVTQSINDRAKLSQKGYTWVLSSNVSAAKRVGNDLYIRFLNGSLYRYDNKGDSFTNLIAAASKGKWVWRFLRRPNVPYSKVGKLPLESDLDVTDEELFEDVTRVPIVDIEMLSEGKLDLFNQLTLGMTPTRDTSPILSSVATMTLLSSLSTLNNTTLANPYLL